ncbi:MAG: CHAT domain-containing protein, partial [Symploca sp. SIO1B1]|nr:CHAT domain-containing protein [Symploca sp. SIO1B1]
MQLKQFGAITLFSLPFTVLSHVSSPLLPNFSIFSASPVMAQTSDSLPVEAEQLFQQGEKQYKTSQFQATTQYLQQALTIFQQIGDRNVSVINLGYYDRFIGNYQRAIEVHQQLLETFQQTGHRSGEVYLLENLGFAYHSQGNYQKAIDFYQQSLEIFQQIGYRQGEAASLGNLGSAYNSLGEYQKAIDFHQQSLEIFQQIGNRRGETVSSGSLGNAYHSLGGYQIDFIQQILEIERQIGNLLGEAAPLGNLGNDYNPLEGYQKAIDFDQQNLLIYREIDNRQGKAVSLNNLGNAYHFLGEYLQAIDFHQQSLEIFQQTSNHQGEAASLGSLGNTYDSLGDYQKAIDFHQQSLLISREIGNRQGEAVSLNNLGNAYHFLGEYPQAIDFLQLSLEIFQQIGNRQGEAASLGSLGNAYDSLGDYPKAIDFHQQSLLISREIGNRQGEAASLGNLGNFYNFLGEYPQAIDFLQLSLEIERQTGNRWGEANSLNNLGIAFFESGNFTAAETHIKHGMEMYESLRVGLEDKHKISIFETHSDVYHNLQQVLVAQNKTHEALEIAERRSAHALVELLKQNSSPQSDKQPLKYPSLKQVKQIAQQQDATLVTYSLVSDRQLYIWVISPTGKIEFLAVDIPKETSLEELVTNGQACILLEQCRNDTNQTLPTIGDWVKLNDDQFSEPWQVVNIQQNTLELRLESWEKGTTIQRPITDVVEIVNALNRQHLQQLHQLLIQPIADLLPKNENDRIIFIPHEQLFLVPFPALQDEDGNYLIEKHTILTAPSIEVLGLTRKKRQQLPDSIQGALVVGNPTMPIVKTRAGKSPEQLSNLPHAETEAIEIAQLLNTQPLTGNSATKAAIVPKLPQARIIHLATHGLLDDFKGLGIPGAIALAPSGTGEVNNGLLTAGELFDMELNAELVVLSACKTGQGDITSDGVIGLSRSLIAAGVPSIIVSLWSVPDAPTADLMTQFYQHLDKNNNKAQALRQAMLDTMKEHPNPKDWAAFT